MFTCFPSYPQTLTSVPRTGVYAMQTQIVQTITAPLAANVGEGLLEMEHFVQACFISVMIFVIVVVYFCFC